MVSVHDKLGSLVLPRESGDGGLEDSPHYDQYENNMQNEQTISQLQEEEEIPMPEVVDNYLSVKILFPRGVRR